MADINVEKRKSYAWLIWLILALILIALIVYFMQTRETGNLAGKAGNAANQVGSKVGAAVGTAASAVKDKWKSIDWNVPKASFNEITDKDVHVNGNDSVAVYGLDETVLFNSNEMTIRPEATKKLKQVASSLNNRYANGEVRIYGYTDSTGTTSGNKDLAEQRARAVQDWLVQNGSISREKISISPMGEQGPVASNANEVGRAKNRRVQIVVRKESN